MKSQQRHQLKQNEFATTLAQVLEGVRENRSRLLAGVVAAVVVIGGATGFFLWRKHVRDQAGALLATARSVTESPIAPAPTVPGATQAPGTYPTVKARQEAALQAFQQVVAAYASTPDGIAAAYEAAGELLSLGRAADAERAYADVIDRAGPSSIYTASARLGLAEALAAQGKYDEAVKEFTDLASQRDAALPVDGILVQLARTYVRAGKPADARAAFKRVVDEFPNSIFVAEARQQLALLG